MLNTQIQHECTGFLGSCLLAANTPAWSKVFLVVVVLFTAYIVHKAVFTQKRLRLAGPVLLALASIAFIYTFNPNHRVYSFHGFFRAAIAYQILNGHVPPADPLFAGQTTHAPWGLALLSACLSSVLDVTPFWSFAIVNLTCLALVMVLAYRISGLLMKDEKANTLSAMIAILAVTMIPNSVVESLREVIPHLEIRAAPLSKKFLNANAVPLGLVFFFLFLYTILKILETRKPRPYTALLLASTVGAGFFYPPMFPALVATVTVISLLGLALNRTRRFHDGFRNIGLVIATSALGVAILSPYLISIFGAARQELAVFQPKPVLYNFLSYLVITLPILIIIVINRTYLVTRLRAQPLVVLSAVVATTAGCYFFVHLAFCVEYKFLILTTTTTGILGGIAFAAMIQRHRKPLVFATLLLFFLPFFEDVFRKSARLTGLPPTYVEKGKYIHAVDPEENELYQWIRNNTANDSIFIDSAPELPIPVFAQRSLLIGLDSPDGAAAMGYGMRMEDLRRVRRDYDPDLFERRERLVRNIYGLDNTLAEDEIPDALAVYDDIYIVVRRGTSARGISPKAFTQVFRSSQGSYAVFKPGKRTD